ncbi:PepSY domain-containing protein [Saccharococcus sp. Marseille-Q5394]|uniref:PepSY domain-containing protein n=1 Tax=Saccharococcus sp. Marseille-Q5394 TaxID=2972778 RepID=UPI0021C57626|nr:PepSY domain-containing protein [Saccharococcus sp. Marseille-Q5394]
MKKWMLIPAVAGVLAIGGVALAEDSVPSVAKQAEKLISLQEAKQVATEKVKGGIVTEIELDKDDGRYHFDVDLKDGKYEYDLEVDAVTGEIIKFEKESDKNHKQEKSDKLLTKEEAIAIVKKKAVGTVKEFELDTDDGRKVYDIEMKDDQFKYEIEIDAVTGEFLKSEKERYSNLKNEVKVQSEKVAASTLKVAEPAKQAVKLVDNKKSNQKTMLTKEQVIAIAKQHASGVVTDFELDDNVYEIEMEDGDIEYELDIDAFTGAILSFERDDD